MIQLYHGRNKLVRAGMLSFSTTLGAMVFSTPLACYYFGTLSIVSLLSNLLCLWLVSIVFALGLVSVLLAAVVPQLGAVCAFVPALGIRAVLWIAGLLEELPFHAVYFNTAFSIAWLAYVYAIFAACALAKRGKYRYFAAVGLSAVSLFAAMKVSALHYEEGGLNVVALDVGQGESVLLISEGRAALVDCGSKNSYIDAGAIAADYLRSAGATLDSVVLTPVYLDAFYRGDERYANIRTVMTIHNIEFQGEMDKSCIPEVFGIPASHASIVEYNNNANMLKAGIEASHAVTTVSRTYAEEILNPYFAYGLEDILAKRRYKIRGILNGIDTDVYNPAKDGALFAKYTLKTVSKKAADKKGLQELVNLPVVADKPLIGMVTRLTNQKGMDLVMEVIEEILSMDIQMVILGTGDWKYETALNELSRRYGNKLAVIINFSKDIASKIYAGSDMFLMPSKFEPCGLSQLIAMRYGSVPIVRETGGLKDTVPAFNPVTREGRGFTFKTYNAYDMLDAIRRAVGTYYNKEEWASIVSNDMSGDYSWKASAKEYVKLYNEITK